MAKVAVIEVNKETIFEDMVENLKDKLSEKDLKELKEIFEKYKKVEKTTKAYLKLEATESEDGSGRIDYTQHAEGSKETLLEMIYELLVHVMASMDMTKSEVIAFVSLVAKGFLNGEGEED